ncbi:MAG: dTDP-4-amino-4,6-dideoxygalactose transaminase [Micrococcales bacterium]
MIPFNRPFLTGGEQANVLAALANRKLSGDGPFTKECSAWLEQNLGTSRALLTHSCTAALEMAAILCNLQPGDEVIMPSYTFVSTANAFVLRGAVPVFVDIRPDTLNIDESLIEAAITEKTRVIVPVHYAGVACEMDTIMEIARRHNLLVVEDAAQGISSTYRGKALGTIGHLGALSFHETKNVVSGEGGALLVNDPALAERAEVIREKGTDRSRFIRGQVDKYTWQDLGSSYLPSELIAAFLLPQLQSSAEINRMRLALWNAYFDAFAPLAADGKLGLATVPEGAEHNAHMFYLLLPDTETRAALIEHLRERGVSAIFHYIPLHSAPAGLKFGRVHGSMKNTDELSARLVRLPLFPELGADQAVVVAAVREFFAS